MASTGACTHVYRSSPTNIKQEKKYLKRMNRAKLEKEGYGGWELRKKIVHCIEFQLGA